MENNVIPVHMQNVMHVLITAPVRQIQSIVLPVQKVITTMVVNVSLTVLQEGTLTKAVVAKFVHLDVLTVPISITARVVNNGIIGEKHVSMIVMDV